MRKDREPMDGEQRAMLLGVIFVVLACLAAIALPIYIVSTNNRYRDLHRQPVLIEEQKTLQAEIAACRGESNDAAVTLCLVQLPSP